MNRKTEGKHDTYGSHFDQTVLRIFCVNAILLSTGKKKIAKMYEKNNVERKNKKNFTTTTFNRDAYACTFYFFIKLQVLLQLNDLCMHLTVNLSIFRALGKYY